MQQQPACSRAGALVPGESTPLRARSVCFSSTSASPASGSASAGRSCSTPDSHASASNAANASNAAGGSPVAASPQPMWAEVMPTKVGSSKVATSPDALPTSPKQLRQRVTPSGTAGTKRASSASSVPLALKEDATSQAGAKAELADVNAGAPLEELDAHFKTMYPEASRSKLASTVWKERLEGMEEVLAVLQQQETCDQLACDATCRMLVGMLVTAKESNFQVVAKGVSVVKLLSEKAVKFSKRAAHWMTPLLVEKLGDAKLKTACCDCLLSLAEVCSPSFMMAQGIDVLHKQKAPKILEHGLIWIKSMCEDFGMKLVKPKQVLDFVKQMLEVANPAVKKSAVQVLVAMRQAMGPQMRGMLADVKPALLASIDEAFSKIVDEQAPADAPKRQVRGCDKDVPAEEGAGGGEAVSLTAPIAAHLKALGDANWKERQAAIMAIDDIVSKARPIGCTGPYMKGACGELWASLKARLKDSNKNLAILVLVLLAKIADAVGPCVDKYAKHIMPNMLALISDNKKAVRDAVIQCLSTWSKHLAAETMLKHLPAALQVEAPQSRQEALRWTTSYLSHLATASLTSAQASVDISGLLQPVVDSLMNRTSEVRVEAEQCLVEMIKLGGANALANLLRDLKPALAQTLRPLCDKAAVLASCSSGCHAVVDHTSELQPGDDSEGSRGLGSGHGDAQATPCAQVDTCAAAGSDLEASPLHLVIDDSSRASGQNHGPLVLSSPAAAAAQRQRKSWSRSTTPPRAGRSLGCALPGSTRPATGESVYRANNGEVRRSASAGVGLSFASTSSAEQARAESAPEWLFIRNGAKQARERRHLAAVGAKARMLQGVDAREIERMLGALQDAMAPVTHPELLSALFSKDLKRQADGLRLVAVGCEEEDTWDSIWDNLDLVLRLCSIRLVGVQRSPLMLLTAMQVLQAVLHSLAATAAACSQQHASPGSAAPYMLTEYEVMLWLPLVEEEMGSNHELVRSEARRIVRVLLHPHERPLLAQGSVLNTLLERANLSRNVKTRTECVVEASAVMQRHEDLGRLLAPREQAKAVLDLAAWIHERDVNARCALAWCRGCMQARV
jgi:hypothetical protein